jgi:hypothetical protein
MRAKAVPRRGASIGFSARRDQVRAAFTAATTSSAEGQGRLTSLAIRPPLRDRTVRPFTWTSNWPTRPFRSSTGTFSSSRMRAAKLAALFAFVAQVSQYTIVTGMLPMIPRSRRPSAAKTKPRRGGAGGCAAARRMSAKAQRKSPAVVRGACRESGSRFSGEDCLRRCRVSDDRGPSCRGLPSSGGIRLLRRPAGWTSGQARNGRRPLRADTEA